MNRVDKVFWIGIMGVESESGRSVIDKRVIDPHNVGLCI